MEGEGVGYKTDVSMVVNSGKIEGFITAEEEKEYKADEVLTRSSCSRSGIYRRSYAYGGRHTERTCSDTNNWMMFGLQPFENAVTMKTE